MTKFALISTASFVKCHQASPLLSLTKDAFFSMSEGSDDGSQSSARRKAKSSKVQRRLEDSEDDKKLQRTLLR